MYRCPRLRHRSCNNWKKLCVSIFIQQIMNNLTKFNCRTKQVSIICKLEIIIIELKIHYLQRNKSNYCKFIHL